MNANQLWAGSDYAWSEYLRRGERYTENYVKRVRVIKVSQKVMWGNEKASTFVEVWDIDEDTEEPENQERTRSVRARDIFMHWDEYADERERREVERAKKIREQAAEEAARNAKDKRLKDALVAKGLDLSSFAIDRYTNQVKINRADLERWLGLDAEQEVA